MNIFGIGIDIIETERIENSIERFGDLFLNRVFTDREQKYCGKMGRPANHYAGRFAAKEAVVKAIGTGIGAYANWTEVEITNGKFGKPSVKLSGSAAEFAAENGIVTIHLSLSHSQDYAAAYAVAVTA